MKKLVFLLLLFVAFSAGTTFSDERLGKVEKYNGLYVFWDCQPVDEFEIVGFVKTGLEVTGAYGERRGKLTKKAAEYYPQGEAIIYDPETTGHGKALVIRFKK